MHQEVPEEVATAPEARARAVPISQTRWLQDRTPKSQELEQGELQGPIRAKEVPCRSNSVLDGMQKGKLQVVDNAGNGKFHDQVWQDLTGKQGQAPAAYKIGNAVRRRSQPSDP